MTNSPFQLHCLPGFLGLPSDWDLFDQEFLPCHLIKYAHSLPHSLTGKSKLNFWASSFHQQVFSSKNFIHKKNILVGYSLGGRLALHSLCEQNNWDAAILISVNPGLTSDEEKKIRLQNDNLWAQRFLKENWNSVMVSWNNQGVFSGQQNTLVREEKNYNRQELSNLLKDFSLGNQENLRPKLKNIFIPVLWLAGEKDEKFSAFAQEASQLNHKIKHFIFPDIGHRVPWEAPQEFKKVCLEFLSSL